MDRKQMLAEIAALEVEVRRKIAARDNLSIDIVQLEEKIRGIKQMYFADALADKGRQLTAVGLTEAIRILMRKQDSPMTAATLKAALGILGFDLKRFKNPGSAIHNTLIRMTKAGELIYNAATNTYRLAETMPAFYGR